MYPIDILYEAGVAGEVLAQEGPLGPKHGHPQTVSGFGLESLPERAGKVAAFAEGKRGVHQVKEVHDDQGGGHGGHTGLGAREVGGTHLGRDALVELVQPAGEIEKDGGVCLAPVCHHGEDHTDGGDDEAPQGAVLEKQL